MAWGAFEKEMLSGKHTKGSVSHSRSDHFALTRQEVQARQLQEVTQKKRKNRKNTKGKTRKKGSTVELKYNCLFCYEVCAEHSPAWKLLRGAHRKKADKWMNFRGQEMLMLTLLGAAIRLHSNLWVLTAKKRCAAPCDTITKLMIWGQRGGKGRERGQITSLLTLVLVQHLSLNIFSPLN